MGETSGRVGTVRAVSGPQVARVARILREDLPGVIQFQRAAVFVPAPTGRPRLLAEVGRSQEGAAPDRLRAALRGRLEVAAPYRIADRDGETLVLPFAAADEADWRGALVLFSPTHRWSHEDLGRAAGTARLIERTLGA